MNWKRRNGASAGKTGGGGNTRIDEGGALHDETGHMRTLTATLMLLSLHATAMDHEALSVLVEAGAIELKPRGLGGHSGESVVVDVRNRTARTLRTSIPAGWLFPSVNEGIQDLLVVRQGRRSPRRYSRASPVAGSAGGCPPG